MIRNFRYVDDIILLAELQELVDRVSRKYSLLDNTKVMASVSEWTSRDSRSLDCWL